MSSPIYMIFTAFHVNCDSIHMSCQFDFYFLTFLLFSSHFRIRLNKVLSKTYDIENQRYPEGYQEAPLAYDAVWSVAFAFNKTMERLKAKKKSLKDFTYTDKEIADEIYAAMNSTQFLGVSVSFEGIVGKFIERFAGGF